jgi:hypothetical protein
MRIKEGHVASISEREERQVEQANASGKTSVVFIHGLWLLPSSWDRWVDANLNPFTEAKVDPKNPGRGPLLILDGEKDHTVPWAIANAAYKRQGATRASPRSRGSRTGGTR